MARHKATARPIVPVGKKRTPLVPLPHTPRDSSPVRKTTPSPRQLPTPALTPATDVKPRVAPVEKEGDLIYFVELILHRNFYPAISKLDFYRTLEDAKRKVDSIMTDPSVSHVDKWQEIAEGSFRGLWNPAGFEKPQIVTLVYNSAKLQ